MSKKTKQRKTELVFSKQLQELLIVSACAAALGVHPPLFSEEKALSPPRVMAESSSGDPKEIESLRQQLLQTDRELHEYKAKLFRSSHPKDEAKIAELGKLLAEKEALNQQLLLALQNMDKEVLLARKQVAAQQTSNDVLSSYIETQRQALKEKEEQQELHLNRLQTAYIKEKDLLLEKIAAYDKEQETLLTSLKEQKETLAVWDKAFQYQRNLSKKLINQLGDLSSLFSVLHQLHEEDLSRQASNGFYYLETAELIKNILQNELKDQIALLSQHNIENYTQLELADISTNTVQQSLHKQIDQLSRQILEEEEQLSSQAGLNFTRLELAQLITNSVQTHLTEQIQRLNVRMEKEQAESNQLQLEIDQLQLLLLSKVDQTETLQQTETETLAYAHDLTVQLNEKETQFQQSQAELERQISNIASKLEEEQRYSQLSDLLVKHTGMTVSEMAEQKSALEQQLSHSSSKLEQEQHFSQLSDLQLQRTEMALSELAEQKSLLEKQLVDYLIQMEQEQSLSQMSQLELQKTENSLADLKEKLADLSQEIVEKENFLNDLQNNLANEKMGNTSLLSTLETVHQELVAAQAQLSVERSSIAEKEDQLNGAEAEMAQQRTKLAELLALLETQEQKQQKDYLSFLAALQALEEARSSLHAQLNDLHNQHEQKSATLLQSQSDLQNAQQEHAKTLSQNEQLKTAQAERIAAMEQQHNYLMAEHLDQSSALMSALEQNESVLEKNAYEIKMLLKHLEVLALKHADTSERSETLEADLYQLSNSLAEKEELMKDANAAIASMQEAIAGLNANLIAEHDEHRAQLQQIRLEDSAAIQLLNTRLTDLTRSLEKEMHQQSDMNQTIERLIAHANHQDKVLAESFELADSLESENDYLKFRLKELEQAARATLAKEAVKKGYETVDRPKPPPLLLPLLAPPFKNE